ncbi:carbohydrate kinase [Allokutzneria sp. A3M-2-11 16]|uniref:carbohydrate kinase family protein n=1 Tax=Allokutzneria sp. A3M-2-11 16 TaxID=2962043 RepID=UPI0020B66525|nr:PfkB family carbohydrate kinase [Allokutzneria sp. A3M-2-11 16]MCP3800151.1 carbohydrate kinase [Allokutzneria sp. A3M-2-11 16]
MIVVGGEALVDLVPSPSGESAVEGLPALLPRLGGGPYNVAVALGRLGSRVSFLSRVSTDFFGDALVGRLEQSTVDTGLLQRGAEPTTLAVVGLAEDGSARYSFHVEGTADRLVADPGPLPEEVRAVSFGTLGMVLEPGASAYEAVLRRESGRGRFTVLDPNIRAALITDPAGYRERFLGWLPHVGLLKLSVEDAAWLADAEDPWPALREWAGKGPAGVVVTLGGDGLAILTSGGGLVRVPGQRVEVVDTIGAGDTVHAAILHWLDTAGALSAESARELPDESWREALEFAARAAAITCSRAGAEPPWADELK